MLAGWFTTEIGRQPWIVYNVMRTADAVSPHGALEVGVTLALFVAVYFIVFGAGAVYILRLIGLGPHTDAPQEGGPGEAHTPSRPLSAAPGSADPAAASRPNKNRKRVGAGKSVSVSVDVGGGGIN